MIGSQILNYNIIKVLGEGGMGTVYLGEHAHLNRKVAIKMLHPKLSKNDALRERFKDEASALAHLQHPNIVNLYDYYESEDGLFLIMEYVEGMELSQHINTVSGPINEEEIGVIFSQILDAFQYAHNKGVVHRDIKPANILITKNNEIKIMDFGIAKILDNQKSLTKTGTQIGTIYYMSPEQVRGEKVDYRSDIYSLGVTLFQMITGSNPYQGETTEFEIYNKIVNDSLPNIKSIYPGAAEYFDNIIKKATNKNKDGRFDSCNSFKDAIVNKKNITINNEEPTVKSQINSNNNKSTLKQTKAGSINIPKIEKNWTIGFSALILICFVFPEFYWLKEKMISGDNMSGFDIFNKLDSDEIKDSHEFMKLIFYFVKIALISIPILAGIILLSSLNVIKDQGSKLSKNAIQILMVIMIGIVFMPIVIQFFESDEIPREVSGIVFFIGPGFWLCFFSAFVLKYIQTTKIYSKDLKKVMVFKYPSFWAGMFLLLSFFSTWFPWMEAETKGSIDGISANGLLNAFLISIVNSDSIPDEDFQKYVILGLLGLGLLLILTLVLFFSNDLTDRSRTTQGVFVAIIPIVFIYIFDMDFMEDFTKNSKIGSGPYLTFIAGAIIAYDGYTPEIRTIDDKSKARDLISQQTKVDLESEKKQDKPEF